jgi:uncharacterized membrane protein
MDGGLAVIANSAAPVHWETVLRPYRSLPQPGFKALMGVLIVVSLVPGIFFISIGAWPVTGFFGLDVALVYLAFRLSYRSASAREVLRLEGGDLTVERVGAGGARQHARLQAFWLRVQLIEAGDGGNCLLVTTHGVSVPIGGFLSPGERRDLARELESALQKWKTAA